MDSLSAKTGLTSEWNVAESVTGLTDSIKLSGNDDDSLSFLIGTGSGMVDTVYFQERTLLAGANETLDLSSIGVADAKSNFNVAFGFAHIKSIKVRILTNSDNTTIASSIRIGGAASNAWNGWLSAGATEDIDHNGSPFVKGSDTGRPVDSTHKNLKIENLDLTHSLTYQILVYGIKA